MAVGALNTLGKYQIRGTLGKGAMGIVYDGFDPVIERRVAIKTIAKTAMDPVEAAELLGRFKREAQAAGRLNHPGIVSIHDYGEDDGLAFIAMEFIKGKELQKYFDSQERFDLQHLVRIMTEVLDALAHAHGNGVVHRDIKPGNIMITDEGRVKVADFGIARIESSMMTQAGTRIGTPAYMSPEQHQGHAVTGRSDLFSAGVILYQFLTGERPFDGQGYALIHQILLRDPTPPSEINFNIPRALDAVTLKALAKRPEDRFANAHEFAEALREAAQWEPSRTDVDFVLDRGMPLGGGRGTMLLPGSARARTMGGTSSVSGGSNLSEVLLEAELVYWKEILNSTEVADFETFVQVFPESPFATLARRRMARIKADAQIRRDADGRQQETLQRGANDADRTVRSAEEGQVQPPTDAHRLRDAEHVPATDQAVGKHEIEADAMPLLVDVVVQRSGENKQAAEPARHATGIRKVRADARARNERGIDWLVRRLDAEAPKLMTRAEGEPNDRAPAMDRSPPVIEQPASFTMGVPHVETASGSPCSATGNAARAHDGSAVPPLPFASSGSRKPSGTPIAVAVVAVLMGIGSWYANRPELARIITAARTQTQQMLAPLQHQAQAPEAQSKQTVDEIARLVEEERARDEAARLVEEDPKPDAVARLVEEQRERDEVARVVEEQRKEEEALAAKRNRQLTLARQREGDARTAAMQDYQRAMARLDQGRTSEAVRLLRELAKNGHGAAARTLGDLYMSGERVPLDRQQASDFYAIAERNGVHIDRSVFVLR